MAFIPPYAEIKHPTVYKFITAMQKEQKNVRVRLCQIQAGDLNEDKTKYQVNKDKRILKLVQNYSKDKIKSYLNDFFYFLNAYDLNIFFILLFPLNCSLLNEPSLFIIFFSPHKSYSVCYRIEKGLVGG